jgi:hypothetical protein
MPDIPREVIEHQMKIHPDAKLVSQKPQRQSIERQDFIRKEVWKLLDAGFIEDVHHPVWLANPVIVPRLTTSFGCALTTLVSIRPIQGPIFTPTNRSNRGIYLRVRPPVLPGCLFWFPSDLDV